MKCVLVALVAAILVACSAASKLTPRQEVSIAVSALDISCSRYLGQGKDRDPILDEACHRLLGDSEPAITTDMTPDAGSSAGGKAATGEVQ